MRRILTHSRTVSKNYAGELVTEYSSLFRKLSKFGYKPETENTCKILEFCSVLYRNYYIPYSGIPDVAALLETKPGKDEESFTLFTTVKTKR
jgi:hypothetical protein